MSKRTVVVMPETQRILSIMGEQIKLARLRRNLATELVAERAGTAERRYGQLRKEPLRFPSEHMLLYYTHWEEWIKILP